MAIEQMKMPQLGESVTEGTISKWLVTPGDFVQKYTPIAEVMTDKVSAEIPSSFTGVIKELVAKEEETLAVNEIICLIEVEEAGPTQTIASPSTKSLPAHQDTLLEKHSMKMRYSPAVLKLSQERGIDLSQVEGSGKGGRITRKDVLALIEANNVPQEKQEAVAPSVAKTEARKQSSKTLSLPVEAGDREIPVTGVRKAIAANMQKSKQEAPHAWMMVEADATNLVMLRNSLKDNFLQKEGYHLTYFAFFVKAIAQALTEFPEMNSMWAGDKIIQKKDIHLSIAVATNDALFVPVIKHADEKSIKGIAREIHELAEKVRTGRLTQEESQGGTFTVNNTGSFGSVQSMGIINYPQAAIVQIETIVKRPVIIDDMIAVRHMVNLCLSLDHRVLDGLICGRFLARVKKIVEGFSKEKTSIF